MEQIFSVLFTVFWFVVLLSIVVFIHEYGHYAVARFNKVKIEAFSIGFGREIFGWNDKNGTRWKFCMIPLGGYVKMFGDLDEASTPDFSKMQKLSKEEEQVSFQHKTLFQKFCIVIAGPAANYLSAIIIMTFLMFVGGKAVASLEISDVLADGAAYKAGMVPGDTIVEINGAAVENFDDIRLAISLNTGEPMNFLVNREGQIVELVIIPEIKESVDIFGNTIQKPMIGIYSKNFTNIEMDLIESFTESIEQAYTISIATLQGIWQILTGQRSTDELGGPIKIAQYSGQSAQLGVLGFLWFMAMISINLGLINLLPIPMLDGGHLLMYITEGVIRRPVPESLQSILFKMGFVLLVSLMIFVTVKDIVSLF